LARLRKSQRNPVNQRKASARDLPRTAVAAAALVKMMRRLPRKVRRKLERPETNTRRTRRSLRAKRHRRRARRKRRIRRRKTRHQKKRLNEPRKNRREKLLQMQRRCIFELDKFSAIVVGAKSLLSLALAGYQPSPYKDQLLEDHPNQFG
jgi:hypothetical protein